MTSIEPASAILRTDKRGNVWRSREQREQLLQEFDHSGLSGAAFAKLTGVKYQTLAGWLHDRRKLPKQMTAALPPVASKPVQWFETVIDKNQPAAGSGLIVRLPSGATLEVITPGQAPLAAAILRAWEKPLC